MFSLLTYSARFSRVLSHRNSFEGIWLLSIITYKYTADTCFNLLRCQKVSANKISGEFVSDNLISIPSLMHNMSPHHRCTITMDLFNASIQTILLFPSLPCSWELLLYFSSQYWYLSLVSGHSRYTDLHSTSMYGKCVIIILLQCNSILSHSLMS